MNESLQSLLALIKANDGINDKARLARVVSETLELTKDRAVFYCADFRDTFQFIGKESRQQYSIVIVKASEIR